MIELVNLFVCESPTVGRISQKDFDDHYTARQLAAAPCIVIGPVCGFVCGGVCMCVCVFVSVTTMTRNFVHRSSPNWVCR